MLTQYPGISPSWSKKLHICIHFLNNPRQREKSLKIDVNVHVVAGGSHSIQSIKKVIDIMNGWYASQLPGKAGRSACCDYFIILEVLTEIELSGNLLNALLIASFNVCVGFGEHPPPPPLFCWVIARRWLRDCLLAIHKQWDLSLRLVLIKPQREEKYLPFSDLLDWIQGAEYNLVQYVLPQPLPPPHTHLQAQFTNTHCIHTYTDSQYQSDGNVVSLGRTRLFLCVHENNIWAFTKFSAHLMSSFISVWRNGLDSAGSPG